MELRHANHCLYKIRYHMVFCVKYRKNFLLDTEIIIFLKNVCFEIGERYCFEFDTIGADGDHVHLFVGAEPKYSPSRVMQIIKSITARKIFKEYPEIKKQLWGGELWSDGDTLEQWEMEQLPMLSKTMLKIRETRTVVPIYCSSD